MAKQPSIYPRRRLLRALERGTAWLERAINRFGTVNERIRPYNPLYHLGTLAIFLLIVLTITGLYLTVFYRPGVDRAYASVAGMSATWLGSLMRTVHRYASDALIVVSILHALKTFFSDRFWGSRWLAWLSGWILLVLFWIIGLMGYWLIWDQPAQWLTEYFIQLLQGPFAYTFFGGQLESATFSLFVIVLFLHIFLPILLIIGIIVHLLRMARASYWAPRWLMIATVLVLTALALWWPLKLALPADVNVIVQQAPLDWWYLGFLPLAERLGDGWFWGTAVLILIGVIAFPWLFPARHDGPAVVIDQNCTGCSACAHECPYTAIEMVERNDDTEFTMLAVVKPSLCTGCGICVGSCPDKAIELDRLHSGVIRQDLQRTLGLAQADGEAAIAVYACERHDALGTLPPLAKPKPLAEADLTIGGAIPLLQAKLPPRINVGSWSDDQDQPRPVITCVVPCTGMLHPNWAAETIEAGGAGAIVVSCPAHDCSYHEGPSWIANRLKRRRTLRKGNVHFWELAPGSRQQVLALWRQMLGNGDEGSSAGQVVTMVGGGTAVSTLSRFAFLRHSLVGLVILFVTFLGAIWLTPLTATSAPASGQIRVVINHGGEVVIDAGDLSTDILEKLPENVDPAQVLGGERLPVRLRVAVDGKIIIEESYEARGLRGEGAIYGLESWWGEPGEHDVTIWLMDDETEWRTVFADTVTVPEDGVVGLLYNPERDAFEE
ncbi:cytochrome b N-terminal domain-containing protein [Candidatus Leptofilum sp.]|uniref:cytochrome b N-terminal domain-containing protein n=1 Tax=Candidatus Leptofilum sp. TaxID=3241576 RepID=UPI003B5AD2AF